MSKNIAKIVIPYGIGKRIEIAIYKHEKYINITLFWLKFNKQIKEWVLAEVKHYGKRN